MSASTERKNRIAAREAGTDKKFNAAQEAAKKAAVSKRNWTLGIIAVLLFIAMIFLLSSPLMYRITTAETIGTKNYSPADVRFQMANTGYRMYVYYGMTDYAQAYLDQTMVRNAALLQYAAENDIKLTQQEKDFVSDSLKTLPDLAAENDMSLSEYMAAYYGKGVNESVLRKGAEESILANKAQYAYYCGLSFTDEDVEAYYQDHDDNSDLYSYAVYQITADETRTDAEAKAEAEDVRISFLDGADDAKDVEPLDRLNDILAELYGPEAKALVHNDEPASSLVDAYRDWLTAENREPGTVFVAQSTTGSGWYVVMFLGHTEGNVEVAQVRSLFISISDDRDDDAAKAMAEELLADWEAGEKTEADFATLASIYSEDGSTSGNGGLYTNLKQGDLGDEADAFCFAERSAGDTAVVAGEINGVQGYHVLYFVGRDDSRSATAKSVLAGMAMSEWIEGLTADLEPVYRWAYKLV